MDSSLEYGSKSELRERLKAALAFADEHDLPFAAIRISEAIDILDADLDSQPDNPIQR